MNRAFDLSAEITQVRLTCERAIAAYSEALAQGGSAQNARQFALRVIDDEERALRVFVAGILIRVNTAP